MAKPTARSRAESPIAGHNRPSGEALRRYVKAAGQAPSPDNNQPWAFRIQADGVEVLHDRTRALPSDTGGLFSFLALGAAIENICLAAAADGWSAHVRPVTGSFPDDRDRAAVIGFAADGVPDPLVTRLWSRHTNRMPYSTRPVPAATLDALSAAAAGGTMVHWSTDRKAIGMLAAIVAETDRIRFEHRPFHEELHRQLRLTREHVIRSRDGLDLLTLGAPPGAGRLLSFLRPWKRTAILNRLGLSRALTVQSGVLVRRSGAIGILTVESPSEPAYLAAGRALQRLWLAADAADLAFQPLGSVPIFLAGREHLTAGHRRRMDGIERRLARWAPGVAGRTLAMVFRVGEAPVAPVRSLRRPVEETLIDETPAPESAAVPAVVRDRMARELEGWNYDEAFVRNLGLVTDWEQRRLRSARVAIAGTGGVGGIHLVTLARLGIGAFTIVDPDEFETVNTNRQYGAFVSTAGRNKAAVMAEVLRDINPEAVVDVLPEPLGTDNMDAFLRDVDVVVDGLDAFEIEVRRAMFRGAAERGIPALTAGPVGFSTAWIVFTPDGMSFDRYFDLRDGMGPLDRFASFLAGLVPKATHRSYADVSYVSIEKRRAPSVGAACQLSAGVAATEVLKLLVGRGPVRPAPWFRQFDPYMGKMVQGRLRWGNRGPIQRLKRRFIRRLLERRG